MMTLEKIAQLAGVSISTVSRVINNSPQVAPETALAVRKVLEQVEYEPVRRQHERRPVIPPVDRGAYSAALLVIGETRNGSLSGFERLLQGVSGRAAEQAMHLEVRFIEPDGGSALGWIGQLDGVLLHGEQPADRLKSVLVRKPAVWLMANRDRPTWGDQVLPDNTSIGQIAADYLVGRGHRQLAFCSVGWDSWSMEVRSRSFCRSAEQQGAVAVSLEHLLSSTASMTGLQDAANNLACQLKEQQVRPTGLFIAEDRQVMPVIAAMRQHGLIDEADASIDLISCNNELPQFAGIHPPPATIDIRTQEIGRQSVNRLLVRSRSNEDTGRVRTLIEPRLVAPDTEQVADRSEHAHVNAGGAPAKHPSTPIHQG